MSEGALIAWCRRKRLSLGKLLQVSISLSVKWEDKGYVSVTYCYVTNHPEVLAA